MANAIGWNYFQSNASNTVDIIMEVEKSFAKDNT